MHRCQHTEGHKISVELNQRMLHRYTFLRAKDLEIVFPICFTTGKIIEMVSDHWYFCKAYFVAGNRDLLRNKDWNGVVTGIYIT